MIHLDYFAAPSTASRPFLRRFMPPFIQDTQQDGAKQRQGPNLSWLWAPGDQPRLLCRAEHRHGPRLAVRSGLGARARPRRPRAAVRSESRAASYLSGLAVLWLSLSVGLLGCVSRAAVRSEGIPSLLAVPLSALSVCLLGCVWACQCVLAQSSFLASLARSALSLPVCLLGCVSRRCFI
eukprot:COSAG04_NODE_216_length_19953_cov_85.343558_2_plen_180_part_00